MARFLDCLARAEPAGSPRLLATARIGAAMYAVDRYPRSTDVRTRELIASAGAVLVRRAHSASPGSARRRAVIASLGASTFPGGLSVLLGIAGDAADPDLPVAREALCVFVRQVHRDALSSVDLAALIAVRHLLGDADSRVVEFAHEQERRAVIAALPVYLPTTSGTKCFAELHHVPWSELRHANGTEEPRPDRLLRALASKVPEDAAQAYEEVVGTLWHQGTIYDATVNAVPFLVALTRPRASTRACNLARSALVLIIGAALRAPATDPIARRVLDAFRAMQGNTTELLGDAQHADGTIDWDAAGRVAQSTVNSRLAHIRHRIIVVSGC